MQPCEARGLGQLHQLNLPPPKATAFIKEEWSKTRLEELTGRRTLCTSLSEASYQALFVVTTQALGSLHKLLCGKINSRVRPLLSPERTRVLLALRINTLAKDVLEGHGLSPMSMKAKEAIALINGTQMMSSLGAEAVERAEAIVRQADVTAALTLEVLRGNQ
ncbi:hypothetical protein AOLI_G00312490 [Acnodon oligacanthus]